MEVYTTFPLMISKDVHAGFAFMSPLVSMGNVRPGPAFMSIVKNTLLARLFSTFRIVDKSVLN